MSHHVLLRLQKNELHLEQILETDPAWFHDPHWVSTGARKVEIHGLPLDAEMTFCEDCGRKLVKQCLPEDVNAQLERSQLLEEEHCAECMMPLDFVVTSQWVNTQLEAFRTKKSETCDVECLSRLRDGIDAASKNLPSSELALYCEMIEHHIAVYIQSLKNCEYA